MVTNILNFADTVKYENKTGRITLEQSTSMMNTPFFINAIDDAVTKQKAGDLNPYVVPAYLFLNSLPLSTLREKYKNVSPTQNTDLDYIFATMTKFGGVHKVPYAWVLKYGSIWHRYKTFQQKGVDILDDIWKDTDYIKNYDPFFSATTTIFNFAKKILLYSIP